MKKIIPNVPQITIEKIMSGDHGRKLSEWKDFLLETIGCSDVMFASEYDKFIFEEKGEVIRALFSVTPEGVGEETGAYGVASFCIGDKADIIIHGVNDDVLERLNSPLKSEETKEGTWEEVCRLIIVLIRMRNKMIPPLFGP